MTTVIFRVPGRPDKPVTLRPNESLMVAGRGAGLPLAGTCGGQMACATCHVVVDPAWADRLPPPGEDESAMLEVVYNLEATSRLGCQIMAKDSIDGMIVSIPG